MLSKKYDLNYDEFISSLKTAFFATLSLLVLSAEQLYNKITDMIIFGSFDFPFLFRFVGLFSFVAVVQMIRKYVRDGVKIDVQTYKGILKQVPDNIDPDKQQL